MTDQTEFQNGKFAVINSQCFAELLSFHYLQSKSKPELHNDSQPVVLDDELMKTNHLYFKFMKTIPLMSSKEKLKCRKVKAVLRYHVPNANKNAEEFAHHLLFLFYPFQHEGELKYLPVSRTYLLKLQQTGVLDVVNRNRHIMEPYSDIVDDALVNLCENIRSTGDPSSQQENDEVEDELIKTFHNVLQSNDPDTVVLQDEY